MSTGNGSNVTWRELNLALDPIKDDIKDIKQMLERRSAFWANAWVLLVVSTLGAVVGTGCWFLFG